MELSEKTLEILDELRERLKLDASLTHASNICTKSSKKLKDNEISGLNSLSEYYSKYLNSQLKLQGYTEDIIVERVRLLNDYFNIYDELGLGNVFTSQGKMRSTILEEFMYILFKDYVADLKKKYEEKGGEKLNSGNAKAYTNLYFTAPGIEKFVESPNVEINVKNQDYAIYRKINLEIEEKRQEIKVPIVAIENKTYVDKTMLEGIIATAEKLKMGNPYTWYAVVTERYDVDLSVDPVYSRIDQIYVLRKIRRKTANIPPIDSKVVLRMFNDVKKHIERPWSNIDAKLSQEGVIL